MSMEPLEMSEEETLVRCNDDDVGISLLEAAKQLQRFAEDVLGISLEGGESSPVPHARRRAGA